MPSLPHRPALAPRDGISSFASFQSSDSYYSNEEIAIIHDVVSAAQDNLSLLPEGERLATNALFQAYDTVLPAYGIDPEEDHHISRLVFRVGGERGDGSLLDKLHAVLSRMGIELEFDSRSEGSRPPSDEPEEPDHELTSQPSPPHPSAKYDSSTTEDEPPEHVSQAPRDRHIESLPTPFKPEQVLGTRPSAPWLTTAILGQNHMFSEPRERLEPQPRSYSASTAGGSEQSPQSQQSGLYFNGQRGASDTTVQPVETAAHSAKNEKPATGLPVRSKPVRTVNWLLPTDNATQPMHNGVHPASVEFSAQPMATEKKSNGDVMGGKQAALSRGQHHSSLAAVQSGVDGEEYEGMRPMREEKQQTQPQPEPQEIPQPRPNPGSETKSQSESRPEYQPDERLEIPSLLVSQSDAKSGPQPSPPSKESAEEVLGDDGQGEVPHDPEETAEARKHYEYLENRATKASRYLQLLRGLSHWQTYAVEKLERTAVARRHILRMRHFDPWELVSADTKLKGRRIFISRLLTLWLRRADGDEMKEYDALANAQHVAVQRTLASWSMSCPALASSYQPRLLAAYLRQWRLTCFNSQALQATVEDVSRRLAVSQVSEAWNQQALRHGHDAVSFRRVHAIHYSLNKWHLETSVEVFRAKMGVKLLRGSLSSWNAACRAPVSLSPGGARLPVRHTDARLGQTLTYPSRGTRSLMAISDRMLKTKVLENWHRQTSALAKTSKRSRRFAAHQGVQKVLDSWHTGVHHDLSVYRWAHRGYFYANVTSALKNWRSKATWRSHTRKSYAQCRQHVKATFTKGYLSRWKSFARTQGNIAWEASEHHNAMERDRITLLLDAWRDESSNDWGANRLLTAAWLQEWQSLSQEHVAVQHRGKARWEESQKLRYWGQWQSTLLQLKSREYVASDVRERNKKRLVRRLLLHWKGDRDLGRSQASNVMRTSLGSLRRGPGLATNRNSLQLSRAVHEPPGPSGLRASRLQELGPTAEEEDEDGIGPGADVDGPVVNTPTRWTGMASSVRLPSMTPFAPLPTPFERELRERYNNSMPSAPAGQLSRLSFAQAQRKSLADANVRRTLNETRPGELGSAE
ncbi:hypothetical protein CMUS01_05609 [Colletotrichum musicola]|uniref:Sfi1 spindle body domain-containing protein n=1 Tax=Colletotrichum musicola TaxID=2175873 RepID=A0A8H6NJF5_9PEZI|nr:hypothetical protein CMUS01_05609 [Colletotrichum musicola]